MQKKKKLRGSNHRLAVLGICVLARLSLVFKRKNTEQTYWLGSRSVPNKHCSCKQVDEAGSRETCHRSEQAQCKYAEQGVFDQSSRCNIWMWKQEMMVLNKGCNIPPYPTLVCISLWTCWQFYWPSCCLALLPVMFSHMVQKQEQCEQSVKKPMELNGWSSLKMLGWPWGESVCACMWMSGGQFVRCNCGQDKCRESVKMDFCVCIQKKNKK